MRDETILKIVAIAAICVLEGVALSRGIDGAALATVFVAIGGLAGYEAGKTRTKKAD